MFRAIIVFSLLAIISSCNEQKTPQSVASLPDKSDFIKINLDTIHAAFDTRVQETSGLLKIDDTYWTNNDSGGEPNLYQYDMESGEVVRSVLVKGVKNIDWEEITADSTHFYIGDFGNNFGNRDNLAIYKGLISDLKKNDEVNVEEIKFSYPDQNEFYNGYNHNHDCEAMVIYHEKLFLFSKNWLDRRCKMYTLPTKPGTYEAKLVSEFNTEGTVTAAALSPSQNELILLGYQPIPKKGFDPFVWKISKWSGDDLLSGEKRRYDFSIRRQMEGVMYLDDRTLAISAEDENGSTPSLFRMNL